jgi:hypothetical protein
MAYTTYGGVQSAALPTSSVTVASNTGTPVRPLSTY